MKQSRIRKVLLYTIYLAFSVVLLLEIALRLYNPFHFRIQGANITLETNKKYIIDNSRIPALDKSIVHTVNNMGFRGPGKPNNFSEILTIITIGGSTTECTYINDGKTWTDVLYKRMKTDYPDSWVNNGGIAGHSTFGHIALMKDHIIRIKPRYALFLVGINDVRRNDLTDSDKSNMSKRYKNFLTFLSRKSELCNVVVNIWRSREAKKRNLADTYIDLKKISDHLLLSDVAIADYLRIDQPFLTTYHHRLNILIELCRKNNIQPVLITQPALPGKGYDPVTSTSLENMAVSEYINGKLWWSQLELYNDETRKAAKELHVPLIDLANQLPKSSLYFYDLIHFTNQGCEEAGSIIYEGLKPYLK